MIGTAAAAALLLLALAVVAHDVLQGPRDFRRLVAATDTRERQRIYRRWAWQSAALYGGGALGGLALLGRQDALGSMPAEFAPAASLFPQQGPGDFLGGVIVGALALGSLLPIVVTAILRKRAAARDETPGQPELLPGDHAALLPRNGAERAWAFWLSINAGVSEELFFRLLVPMVLLPFLGNAIAAFAAATLLFGLAHAYQGWTGIAVTALLGGVLAMVYLTTGELWLAILLHAFLDVNSLVIRPALMRRLAAA